MSPEGICGHFRFSKMISLHAKNLESAPLAEPHIALIFSCRTLTRSEKVSCRTLRIAEPKPLKSEKDYLAEHCNAGGPFENAQDQGGRGTCAISHPRIFLRIKS